MVEIKDLPKKWQEEALLQIRNTGTNAFMEQITRNGRVEKKESEGLDTPVHGLCTHYRKRFIDYENLQCKFAIDTIVKAGILPDDRIEFLERITHKQVKVKTREEEKTVIELFTVADIFK